MQKYKDTEIRPFQFSDLKGTHVIAKDDLKAFEFKSLAGESVTSDRASDEELRSERSYALKNNFKIDDIVRDYRGLSRQEQNDLEQKIQQEVKKRLDAAFEDAYKEGLEKGRLEGEAKAAEAISSTIEQKIEEFSNVLDQVRVQSEKFVDKNRQDIHDFVKRFTKWIVLKEINDELYLEKLLEKLLLELNVRKNLIIKVGKANFSQMPQVISAVEAKLGNLQNVRLEIVPEINHPGIILESENGLIDGSIEGVFQNIDKIFEQVNTP